MGVVDPQDCLFCKIARHNLEANVVFEDDDSLAFRDLNPQAPTHILVIPKRHISSLTEATKEDEPLLGHLLTVARKLAKDEKLSEKGYRVVVNNGSYAGQTVFHIHVHLLGGRSFRWPPG